MNEFDNVVIDKTSAAWYQLIGMERAATVVGASGTFASLYVTGLTSGRIPYITTGGLFTDSANLLYDGTTITQAATLSADTVQGISLSYTPSGSTSYRVGFDVTVNAGYTGTSPVTALQYKNASTSSPTAYNGPTTEPGYYPNANFGIFGYSYGANSGNNVGSFNAAANGLTNYGSWNSASVAKASGNNVGIYATGRNTGASGIGIGGYFSLRNTTSAPAFVSAALIADNDDQASAIFLARDNATTMFIVADGGNVGMASTKKFYWDGIAVSGDTYTTESSANVLDTYVGGTKVVSLASTGTTLAGTASIPGQVLYARRYAAVHG